MIPGADAWPRFTRNKSEQFEARLSLVEVLPTPSIFFSGLAGSRIPIAVAHGEGYADFSQRGDAREGARGAALRRQPRPADRGLSRQPERQPGRADRGDHRRWPLHGADAAPGAGVPQRADELDLGRRAASPAPGCGSSRTRGASWARRGLRSGRFAVPAPASARRPRPRRPPAAIRAPRRHASSAPCGRCPAGSRSPQRGSTEASRALIARTGAGEVSPPSSSTGISSARQASSGSGSAKAARNSAPTLGICSASRCCRPASIAAQVPAPDQ